MNPKEKRSPKEVALEKVHDRAFYYLEVLTCGFGERIKYSDTVAEMLDLMNEILPPAILAEKQASAALQPYRDARFRAYKEKQKRKKKK